MVAPTTWNPEGMSWAIISYTILPIVAVIYCLCNCVWACVYVSRCLFSLVHFQLWQWQLVPAITSTNIPAPGHGRWTGRRRRSGPNASCPGSGLFSCYLLWTAVHCHSDSIPTGRDATHAPGSPGWVDKGLSVWHSKANMVNILIRSGDPCFQNVVRGNVFLY